MNLELTNRMKQHLIALYREPFKGKKPITVQVVHYSSECPSFHRERGHAYLGRGGRVIECEPARAWVRVGMDWIKEHYPHSIFEAVISDSPIDLHWMDTVKPMFRTGSSFEPESEDKYAD